MLFQNYVEGVSAVFLQILCCVQDCTGTSSNVSSNRPCNPNVNKCTTAADCSIVSMFICEYDLQDCKFNVRWLARVHILKKTPLLTKRHSKVKHNNVVTQTMKTESKPYVRQCFETNYVSNCPDMVQKSANLKTRQRESATISMSRFLCSDTAHPSLVASLWSIQKSTTETNSVLRPRSWTQTQQMRLQFAEYVLAVCQTSATCKIF